MDSLSTAAHSTILVLRANSAAADGIKAKAKQQVQIRRLSTGASRFPGSGTAAGIQNSDKLLHLRLYDCGPALKHVTYGVQK